MEPTPEHLLTILFNARRQATGGGSFIGLREERFSHREASDNGTEQQYLSDSLDHGSFRFLVLAGSVQEFLRSRRAKEP